MRFAALVMLLLLPPTVAAETTTIAAGPATVQVATNDVPSCVLQTSTVPCPAGYDDASTLHPQDDTLFLYRSVDRVRVQVDGPLPMSFNVSHDLRGQQIEHHFIDQAESVIVPSEAAFPEPGGAHTYTISHPNNVEFVVSLKDKTPLQEDVSIPVFLFFTDRNGTHVPNGFAQNVDDSDTWGPKVLDAGRLCWIPQLGAETSPTCEPPPAQPSPRPGPPSLPACRPASP